MYACNESQYEARRAAGHPTGIRICHFVQLFHGKEICVALLSLLKCSVGRRVTSVRHTVSVLVYKESVGKRARTESRVYSRPGERESEREGE